ncbi:hypothetical protein F5050DRAFT_1716548 [Lentinula boryana]|uniref:Uncharacterized protein n=1 Tax=Lentinula boryana TaxID=40481 RepID=A0ABQ8PWR6_9AGAR|nr:hypothetical protein F5050DRAFT_1716548 [Lentinula boryana]
MDDSEPQSLDSDELTVHDITPLINTVSTSLSTVTPMLSSLSGTIGVKDISPWRTTAPPERKSEISWKIIVLIMHGPQEAQGVKDISPWRTTAPLERNPEISRKIIVLIMHGPQEGSLSLDFLVLSSRRQGHIAVENHRSAGTKSRDQPENHCTKYALTARRFSFSGFFRIKLKASRTYRRGEPPLRRNENPKSAGKSLYYLCTDRKNFPFFWLSVHDATIPGGPWSPGHTTGNHLTGWCPTRAQCGKGILPSVVLHQMIRGGQFS